MRIAFYAPMKAPDDLTPSGDREMAGQLLTTLALGGHEVELASAFRAYDGVGDPVVQEKLRAGAEAEAARIIGRYQRRDKSLQPELWFSYHVYYKSPDWIGPKVARALNIPYVVAEASYAASRADGPWAAGHLAAELAIKSADLIFSMTSVDRKGVDKILSDQQLHRDLPPFLDPAPFLAVPHKEAPLEHPARLLAVGMMRPGDKAESYRRLAEYLMRLKSQNWSLSIIGDGPAREEVANALAPLGQHRLHFEGSVRKFEMPQLYAQADIYVWPAAGEAYGMALLEAQASGLPIVAGRVRGVPDVMLDGQTGFLTPEGDAEAFAGVVDFLIANPDVRRKMGGTARRFVSNMRGMDRAALILNAGFAALEGTKPAPSRWRRFWRRPGAPS